MTNTFLPKNYNVPKSGGNYMKFEQGENIFRILTSPIIGWEDWQDKKPIRFRMNEKPERSIDPQRAIKHFWAMVVWNYNAESIQILEITQASIQSAIKNLVEDSDWGKPFEYDIKITREGESLETKYTVNPKPKKELDENIKKEFESKTISLEALFTNEDPFIEKSKKDLPDDDEITIDDIDM